VPLLQLGAVSGECCGYRGGHKRARAARSQGEERRPWFGASEFLCVAAGAHKQKALCMCRALSEGGGAGSLPQSTLAHWSVAMSAIAQCPEILVGILGISHRLVALTLQL